MNDTKSTHRLPPWAQDIENRANAEDRAEGGEHVAEEDPSPDHTSVLDTLKNVHLGDATGSQSSAEDYATLIESQPEDALEKWKSLYHARAPCHVNHELNTLTNAINEVFDVAHTDHDKAVIVGKFFHAGFCSFYREILNESNLFDEHPVRTST